MPLHVATHVGEPQALHAVLSWWQYPVLSLPHVVPPSQLQQPGVAVYWALSSSTGHEGSVEAATRSVTVQAATNSAFDANDIVAVTCAPSLRLSFVL